MGVPIGVGGLSQLVKGPQFSTGVGLVQYGAKAVLQAREREVTSLSEVSRIRTRDGRDLRDVEEPAAAPDGKKGRKIWNWLRTAF